MYKIHLTLSLCLELAIITKMSLCKNTCSDIKNVHSSISPQYNSGNNNGSFRSRTKCKIGSGSLVCLVFVFVLLLYLVCFLLFVFVHYFRLYLCVYQCLRQYLHVNSSQHGSLSLYYLTNICYRSLCNSTACKRTGWNVLACSRH